MRNLIALIIFCFIPVLFFSQNVGIGTTSPTNTLHIVVDAINPNQDPVRFEGIRKYISEDSVLVVNPSTGVVKYMPMADILNNIPSNILDSLILTSILNNTDTIYNNQSVRDSIISIMLGNSDSIFSTQIFKDSVLRVILNNMDTIFTLTRDSLLTDSTFMNTLRDSIDTDIDSMVFVNDTLYLYEDNQVLTAYINASTDTNLVDSLIVANSDTLYTIISDSLLKDTLWIKNLDSLLSIYGDTIYFNDSSYTLVRDSLLGDTLFIDSLYTIISDSLLSDSLWLDSIGKLINDKDWNTNINGTGLEAAAAGNNVASGNYAIVAGFSDTATGQYSVITGGQENKALATHSSVLGGYQNYTNSSYGSVGGYRDSVISSSYANVASGRENSIASSSYTVIPGGYRNKITNSSSYSSVSGYLNILDNSTYSFIHGRQDTITNTGTYGTVFGRRNTINDAYESSILGGRDNKILTGGGDNVITGGRNNRIIVDGNSYTSYSIISGGTDNLIIGDTLVNNPGLGWSGWCGIFSGGGDTLDGVRNTVIVGADFSNITGGIGNGIHSGRWNKIYSSNYSTILGGTNNNLFNGQRSAIIGGDSNSINTTTYNSIILGGRSNVTNNFAQVVLGHYSTNTIAVGSSASAIDPDNILFKIGNGTGPSALSDAMVVKANGNVGIGVFNPSESLEVNGNILASGTITPSDERYKTNITTLDNALSKLLKLRGVNYEMKEEYKNKGFGDGIQIGVIAQEVEKIYPELIQTNSQTGYKGVDYSKFTPILIEAIKEQQAIIKNNEEEISNLKKRLEILEKILLEKK